MGLGVGAEEILLINIIGGCRETAKYTHRLYPMYYRPQTKFAKVMFFYTCLSVILFTGEVPSQVPPPAGTPPKQVSPKDQRQIHPLGRYIAPGQVHPPCRYPILPTGTPPAQSTLGDTGNKRAVRILLECNLVLFYFCAAF